MDCGGGKGLSTMSTVAITIAIDDREVLDALARLQARLGDAGMAPAMRAIGEALTDSTQRRFATGTGPDGQRWPANARATLEALLNRTRGGVGKKGKISAKGSGAMMGKKPLVASGQLAEGIRYQLIPGGVAVGTNRFANAFKGGAAIHQFGGMAGRGHKVKIPARPFLGFSANDQNTVLTILRRHLGEP